MICPVCGKTKTRIIDTGDPTARRRRYALWKAWSGQGDWRLHRCLNPKCRHEFPTEERPLEPLPHDLHN